MFHIHTNVVSEPQGAVWALKLEFIENEREIKKILKREKSKKIPKIKRK